MQPKVTSVPPIFKSYILAMTITFCTVVLIILGVIYQERNRTPDVPVPIPSVIETDRDENLPDNYFRIKENEIAVIDGTEHNRKLKHWINHPSTAYKIDSNGMIIYFSSVPGEYHFFGSETEIYYYKVVVTDKVPVDPIDPVDPVDPIPTPTAPFPANKLCVLIVEETSDRRNLTTAQLNAITSAKVHRYIKEQGGDFALVDPDSPLEGEEEWVTAAMKVKRGKLPWIVISNGKTGASEAVVDLDTLLKIIKKHGKE